MLTPSWVVSGKVRNSLPRIVCFAGYSVSGFAKGSDPGVSYQQLLLASSLTVSVNVLYRMLSEILGKGGKYTNISLVRSNQLLSTLEYGLHINYSINGCLGISSILKFPADFQ